MKNLNYLIVAVAIVLFAAIAGSAYKYKYRAQETITVTGLGEQEFTSDLIVWRGWITEDNISSTEGYKQLERSRKKVLDYITSRGIPTESVVFMFVNVNKNYESIYSDNKYVGSKFSGYNLRQQFSIESTDVEAVEEISREISSLIAQGVQMDAIEPSYYYSKLDNLKLELIEKATADAKARADKIASESGSKLRKLKNARMGVFQITGANTNEEFSAGGNFNTSSKNKKARVTIRLEYNI